MEKICVAVRVRPAVSQESIKGSFWKVEDNRISLHKPDGTPFPSLSYAFDHVFDDNCTNGKVYELLTKDIIHAAVAGFNGTVFAYGQTSSGKTFTMNGSKDDPGVIHQAVKDIFNLIEMVSDREFLIRVSYMEIYNEEINDLFVEGNQKLQIHESLERGIYVAGLREEIVSNAEQVLKLIESGEVNRHFGETNMNARSSRSHTIFRMVIESKGKDSNHSSDHARTDAIRVSVLNLVDLAGSERIAKTGADGVRLREGKHINKSLMVLGNVINKLSDGAKQRAHIPYRDSKLTRILQSALGGNAKTSIICTIAPEEIHIEETKGTLQFASRAKRVTNCAQVNEILTDAALLKRQKLEIEELRRKLQGSHAEVLEQEILKLRNDMLKYELDRDRLELELEQERRSQKERDQCIREQQLKIHNLSSLVASSDCDRNSSQGMYSERQSNVEFSDSSSICQGDSFVTPNLKAAPDSFVVRRTNYSREPNYSPLPDTIDDVADEDAWLEMNKGYIADLDSIQITSARKVQSFPPTDASPALPSGKYQQEVQILKRQLKLVTEEKNDLEKKHTEQMLVNDGLMKEVQELKREILVIQDIPRRLRESVTGCKDIYKDVLLSSQKFVPAEDNLSPKLLATASEIGVSLFSRLEECISITLDTKESTPSNDPLGEEHKLLLERIKSMITSFVSSETSIIQDKEANDLSSSCGNKGCLNTGGETELERVIKEKYNGLKEELEFNNQLLESTREKCSNLERDFQILKEERDSLAVRASDVNEKLERVVNQKENVLKDLNEEAQRRKCLEDEIKQFSVAFADRQRLFMSLHNEVRSKIESFREKPASVSSYLGR